MKHAALASARALLAVVLLTCAPLAAALSQFHPDLIEAEAELDTAQGPEVYAALRRLWATANRAEPGQVEDALIRASESRRLSAPARAYASLLVAYARSRRGDFVGAKSRIQSLGFVNEWWIVGPFDNEGKAGFDQPFER